MRSLTLSINCPIFSCFLSINFSSSSDFNLIFANSSPYFLVNLRSWAIPLSSILWFSKDNSASCIFWVINFIFISKSTLLSFCLDNSSLFPIFSYFSFFNNKERLSKFLWILKIAWFLWSMSFFYSSIFFLNSSTSPFNIFIKYIINVFFVFEHDFFFRRNEIVILILRVLITILLYIW